jgi:TolB-like protein
MSVRQPNLQRSQEDARYQSNTEKLGEIVKRPGVANILDGSAQDAADQVCRNFRSVNAQSDSHLCDALRADPAFKKFCEQQL